MVAPPAARPWSDRTLWIAAATSFLLSLFLRYVAFWGVTPYGDEGGFYWFAAHPFQNPSNIHDLYFDDWNVRNSVVDYRPLPTFWYRPAHFLLLAPGAIVSFDGFRLVNLVITSLLPVVSLLWLRSEGVRPAFAVPAAFMVVLQPTVAAWSFYGLAEGLLATTFVTGLWLLRSGRIGAATVAFATAAWVKETAEVGILALLVRHVWLSWRAGSFSLWPVRWDRPTTGLFAALIAGCVPTLITLVIGGPMPGGPRTPEPLKLLDEPAASAWILAVLVMGLFVARARDASFVALAYPVFYAGYALSGQGLNLWYFLVSHVLAILGAAVVLDRLWTQAPPRRSPARRALPAGLGILLVTVVLVAAFASSTPVKARFVHPVTGLPQDSIQESARFEHSLNGDLWAVHAAAPSGPGSRLLLVDVFSSHALYPLSLEGRELWMGTTRTVREYAQDLTPWIDAIENRTDATIVASYDEALNHALRETYQDCISLQTSEYQLIVGKDCAGRGERLRSDFARRTGPRTLDAHADP